MRLWLIATLECRRQLRSAPFAVVTMVAVILTALAITTAGRDLEIRRHQFDQLRRQRDLDRTREAGKLLARSLEPGLRVLHEPTTGSIIARGLEGSAPAYWDLTAAGLREGPPWPSVFADSAVGTFGDLESIVRVVLGLLAVLVGTEAIAGGRAAGHLWTHIVQPLSSSLIVTGKLLGCTAALLIALTAVLGAGLISLYVQSIELQASLLMHALVGMGVIGAGYLVLLTSASIVICAFARVYATALLTALAMWAYVAVIGPHLVVFGGRALVPLMQTESLETNRQRILEGRARSTSLLLGRAYLELMGENALERQGDKPSPEVLEHLNRLWQQEMSDTRVILGAIEHRYETALAAQARLIRWLSWASPGNVLIDIASDLAGTGRSRRGQWDVSVKDYRRAIDRALFDDPPRFTLRVPADEALAVVSLDRRPLPTYGDLPASVAPADSFQLRLHQVGARMLGFLLLVFVVSLASILTFARGFRPVPSTWRRRR